jgi:uncharacterized damage-inducible protein DinB
MSWRELLTREIEYRYSVTEKLLDRVEDSELDWKPATGENWMTTGQLLRHISDGCGAAFKGFVTGDWGMPADFDPAQMNPEDMLPPAEKMPAVTGVDEARKILAEDKKVAIEMLEKVSDDDLAKKPAPAPWDPSEMILGHRLLQMIDHLNQHKGQLFYYLKLQGKPVNTGHLWG